MKGLSKCSHRQYEWDVDGNFVALVLRHQSNIGAGRRYTAAQVQNMWENGQPQQPSGVITMDATGKIRQYAGPRNGSSIITDASQVPGIREGEPSSQWAACSAPLVCLFVAAPPPLRIATVLSEARCPTAAQAPRPAPRWGLRTERALQLSSEGGLLQRAAAKLKVSPARSGLPAVAHSPACLLLPHHRCVLLPCCLRRGAPPLHRRHDQPRGGGCGRRGLCS